MTPKSIYIRLFGRISVSVVGGPTVEIPAHQAGTLLAYLALNLHRAHSREELADIIWPEDDHESARRKLRQRLHGLRQQLESAPLNASLALVTTRSTVQLDPELVTTDVAEFGKAILAAAETNEPAVRIRALNEATALYQDELLPGCYEEVFEATRRQLSDSYQSALHDLALAQEDAGLLDRALETGRKLVALEPLNEEAHCLLMRVYAAKGQPTSVARQYKILEEALENEIGTKPSTETIALLERLREEGHIRVAERDAVRPDHSQRSRPGPNPQPNADPSARSDRSFRRRRTILVGGLGLLTVACALAFFLWKAGGPHKGTRAGRKDGPDWVRYYELTPGETNGDASAVTVAPDGSICVAGFVRTTKTDVDFLTLKYEPKGGFLWRNLYNGTGNDVDRARCITADSEGNVYVSGDSDNGHGVEPPRLAGLDVVTIKYGPGGDVKWKRRYDDVDHSEDRPVKIALDSKLNLYVLAVCSRVRNRKVEGTDIVLIKYSSEGAQQWVKRFDSEHRGLACPTDLVITRDGNLAVCGYTRESDRAAPEYDYVTMMFTVDGKSLWTHRYGEHNRADDFARCLGATADGGVVVVGEGRGPVGTLDQARTGCIRVRYSRAGDLVWVRGTASEQYRIPAVASAFVCADGSTLVTGNATNPKGSKVFRTVFSDLGGLPRQAYDCPGTGRVVIDHPIAALMSSLNGWMVSGRVSRKDEVDFQVADLSLGGSYKLMGGVGFAAGPAYPRAAVCDGNYSLLVVGQGKTQSGTPTLMLARYSR